MIIPTIGGIVAAQSTMQENWFSTSHCKEKVQEEKPAPIVYQNKNINRWAKKKPVEGRIA